MNINELTQCQKNQLKVLKNQMNRVELELAIIMDEKIIPLQNKLDELKELFKKVENESR